MRKTAPSKSRRLLVAAGWWAVLIVALVLLDDMVFGPISWIATATATSLFGSWGTLLSTAAMFIVSFALQMWLNVTALTARPSKVYVAFEAKLIAGRKRPQLQQRQQKLQGQVRSGLSALALAPLVGGVVPIIFLIYGQKMSGAALLRLSFATSAIYAVEFALLHGGYGLGRALGWLLDIVA